MKIVLSLFGIAASGLALSLYARVAWPWSLLGWVMFVPWLAALDRLTSLGAAVGAALAMAVAFCFAVFAWFPEMVADYSGAPLAVTVPLFVVAAPLLEPQLLVFAVARHLARGVAPRAWLPAAAIGAGFYVGAEWGLPKVMGDTIGHGQLPSTLIRQAADLVGAHGITFVLLVANEAMLELARRLGDRRRPLARRRLAAPLLVLAAMALGPAAYGALRVRALAESEAAPLRVAAVQANISHYDRLREGIGTFAAVELILETHFSLSAQATRAAPVDLLLWPETIYPTTFGAPKSDDGAAFDRAIAAFVQRQGVPLVFGTYDAGGGDEYNSAVVLQPTPRGGVEFDVYRKTRLFPFTEYLPAALDSEWVRRRLPWAGTWQPGDGARTLPVTLADGRTLRLAPLICYDAVDPMLAIAAARDGAEVLLTLSNDSWFDYPGARELILAVSTFRSIETRRPQVRATPTGISAAVDQLGNTVAAVEPNRREVLLASVRPAMSQTPMVRLGNWFPPLALSLAALALPVFLWRRRGSR